MLKQLTERQQKVFDKILSDINVSSNGRAHVHLYYKDSWKTNGGHEGHRIDHLDAIEKKGWIVQLKESDRRTGVFNPVADSWGYSTYILNISAELSEEAKKELGI